MDVDSGAIPKLKADDLTEYNLDDYDNDVEAERTFLKSLPDLLFEIYIIFSCWSL